MVTEHGLSDRKLKILYAIIRTYLETGEPVGFSDNFEVYGLESEFCDDSKRDGRSGRAWLHYAASYISRTNSFG